MAELRPAPFLDVVVPCFNEEEVLESTCGTLGQVLAGLAARGEISDWRLILVDNASTDGTLDLMHRLFASNPRVTVVELRRNFGFQGSLSAGLHEASGDAVVSIDADLQDPPEIIEQMVAHYRRGQDLVLGVRTNRKEADSLLVRVLAAAYYRLAGLLRTPTVPQHGDFRLIGRDLLEVIKALPERNRFLRTMIPQLESRYATVPYSRRSRQRGRSKHGVLTVLAIALDGIAGFGFQPLRLLFLLSGVLLLASMIALSLEATAALVLFLSAVNVGALALVGEYLGRVFVETRGRPPFLVRKVHTHRVARPRAQAS
jgi:glycosyltransferase involved in cell wall biosynthesis